MKALPWALALSLFGCPAGRTPAGAVSAAPAIDIEATPAPASAAPSASAPAEQGAPPAIQDGWSIEVTSASRGVNPALFDTPEKRARALYDHAALASGGVVRVEQRTLHRTATLDAAQAKALQDAVLVVNWPKVKMSTELEEALVGGTIFRFKVTIAGQTTELKTGRLSQRPALKAIVELLKKAAGAP